ncbi:UNVERIFIED_CONTAM: putative mitochondrial protein [Sesamum latifolium]|uniref:Mitochondrial protein n=1 Tax=Sesamum latifolium TaxID=2727402 RepID=A0AAW2VEJ9_9LAMI
MRLLEELKSELEECLAREEICGNNEAKQNGSVKETGITFFHARANERRKRNTIRDLTIGTGSLTSDQVIATVSPRVTREMNEVLCNLSHMRKSNAPLDQMYPYKSPGPDVSGRSKRELGAKRLSQAGRMVLIKTVAQAIPTYAIGFFLLPDGFLHELESMSANFFWQHNEGQNIHWLSWKKLCKDKQDEGVGFRNLKAFNLAMLAKQAWRLISFPDSLLSRCVQAKYYPDSDFLNANSGGKPSYTWLSILATRDLIQRGTRWRVGDGSRINIISDPWLPKLVSFKLIKPPKSLPSSSKVRELMEENGRGRNEETLDKEFEEEDANCIKFIELGFLRTQMYWNGILVGRADSQ